MKAYSILVKIGLIGLLFSALVYCKKEVHNVIPTITASAVTAIAANAATAGGTVTTDGGAEVTARGVCWSSTNSVPTISDSKTTDGSGLGNFSSSITGLTAGTTYNLRAYATNSVGTAYFSQAAFKTLALAPVLTTADFSSVTSTSFNSGGNITSDGGSFVTAKGVCWGTNQNPSISSSKTTDGTGIGNFTSLITGLTPGTTFYVRSYATNSIGTTYGNQISTKTLAILPTLETIAISSITSTTANSGGNITFDGGATVIARGVCWSETVSPTIINSKTVNSNGIGVFTSLISDLAFGTTYYVRAYATNSIGTVYGNEHSFKTLPTIPTLTTTAASSITNSTAKSGGNITSDGRGIINGRGVCWSTSSNPTTANDHTNDGIGIGDFTSLITNLRGSTYYVRAYATNYAGTAYGNQVTFTIIVIVPTITTTDISSITSSTAISGGSILSDGGSAIISRGLCWSTSSNPTIENSKTNEGTGMGNFTSSLTYLTENTTYFIRSYATNSAGTSYGNQISFKTSIHVHLPILSTIPLSKSNSYVISGGIITSDGGGEITARGICFFDAVNPTILNLKTSDGSGIGSYGSRILEQSLRSNTIYYIRAYATNSAGTAYGNVITYFRK